MVITGIAVENVRSFLERQELIINKTITILVGPNGGGKTNSLDIITIMIKRYLLSSRYLEKAMFGDGVERWHLRNNDSLNTMTFEKHSLGSRLRQQVEITIQVCLSDLTSMKNIKEEADITAQTSTRVYTENPWSCTAGWRPEDIKVSDLFTFTWTDGNLVPPESDSAKHFLQYLHLLEIDNSIRNELDADHIAIPLLYLPVNRTSTQFNSKIVLSRYNDQNEKRQFDAISSRSTSTSIVSLAIGRLGKRYRRLLDRDNMSAKESFRSQRDLVALSKDLEDLGYRWDIVTINPDTNEYDIELQKEGAKFLVGSASSGERELLTYLFAIYVLQLKDSLIIVDEPELHLHPRWQTKLVKLFERLTQDTGNQFIMATHSPTFISPSSIQYVSRIFSINQMSKVTRLDASGLPNAKHLFNIINSQNNERLFFSDRVILVEGISDRIFFDKVFATQGYHAGSLIYEILSVGGKGLFSAYKQILDACQVPCSIIADRDYLEQVGNAEVKAMMALNCDEIKKDVIENVASKDGAALVGLIEEAFTSGNWDDARDLWAYIKSNRIKLVSSLDEKQKDTFQAFIMNKRHEQIFVLMEGALEAYLPLGLKSKDLEKLIAFLEEPDYWEKLPTQHRQEIEDIVDAIMRA